jgi:hypothetical protein
MIKIKIVHILLIKMQIIYMVGLCLKVYHIKILNGMKI